MPLLLAVGPAARGNGYIVANTNDSGAGSLRAALAAAASHTGPDTIAFSAAVAGKTIRPVAPLPVLSDVGTEINGDIDADGDPDVVIDGSLTAADQTSIGFVVGADDCAIRGLVVNSFWWYQIDAYPGARTEVSGCYINTDLSGVSPSVRNDGEGVRIGATDMLGVPGRAGRNIICQGPSCGVRIFGQGATVRNNFVGVNVAGKTPFYPTRTGTAIAIGAG